MTNDHNICGELRKGDRVRDAEGHEGDVVNVYLQQGKVRVRWHGGYGSTEYPVDLEKLPA